MAKCPLAKCPLVKYMLANFKCQLAKCPLAKCRDTFYEIHAGTLKFYRFIYYNTLLGAKINDDKRNHPLESPVDKLWQ